MLEDFYFELLRYTQDNLKRALETKDWKLIEETFERVKEEIAYPSD